MDFVIPALVSRTDLSVPDSRANIARELAGLINQLDEMDQYEYWNKLAEQLNVPLDTLRASLGTQRDRRGRRRRNDSTDADAAIEVSPNLLTEETSEPVEEYILALLIQHPDLLEDVRDADPQFFRHTENRQLFTAMLTCPTIGELKEGLDSVLGGLLGRLEERELPPMTSSERQSVRNECLSRLEERHLRDFQFNLLQTEAPEVAPQRELEPQIRQVNQRLRDLLNAG